MVKRTNKKPGSVITDSGEISYTLTRASRRRSITIRIEESAKVMVSAPFHVRVGEIEAFIREKSGWIVRKLLESRERRSLIEKRRYQNGHDFLFLGKKFPLQVRPADVPKVTLTFGEEGWRAEVPSGLTEKEYEEQLKTSLLKWYRKQAEEILGTRLFDYARRLKVAPRRVAIGSQKRIWGSYNHRTQSIRLNWQIVLSPPEVVDYVLVHELCHLKVPDHSRRFWAEVERVIPDYRQRQGWLKANAVDMVLP